MTTKSSFCMVLKISYVCTHESCSPFNHHHDRNEDRVTFAWSCPVVIAAKSLGSCSTELPNFPTSSPSQLCTSPDQDVAAT